MLKIWDEPKFIYFWLQVCALWRSLRKKLDGIELKKESLAQAFFCEFCETSKITFFTKQLRTTASVKLIVVFLEILLKQLTKEVILKNELPTFLLNWAWIVLLSALCNWSNHDWSVECLIHCIFNLLNKWMKDCFIHLRTNQTNLSENLLSWIYKHLIYFS